MYKCVNNSAPFYLRDDILYANEVHNYMTRNIANDHLYIPQARTEYFKKSLLYIGPKLWNELGRCFLKTCLMNPPTPDFRKSEYSSPHFILCDAFANGGQWTW